MVSDDDCQRDEHGSCQHLAYDSENERWTIPSGTHIFMGHTVFADSFTDYLATDPPETPEQQTDDPAGELKDIIDTALNYSAIDVAIGRQEGILDAIKARLMESLILFTSNRDRRIWDHAYKLGHRRVKR